MNKIIAFIILAVIILGFILFFEANPFLASIGGLGAILTAIGQQLKKP